jgi:hypothetical protein
MVTIRRFDNRRACRKHLIREENPRVGHQYGDEILSVLAMPAM